MTTGTKACMTLADAELLLGEQPVRVRWQGAGGGDARNITAAVSRSSVPQGSVRVR